MTYFAPLVILPAVALGAGSRIDLSVDHVLAEEVAAVRQVSRGRTRVLVARLDLLPVRVTVGAVGVLMTGGTGQALILRVVAMLLKEGRRLVIERLPLVGMTVAAVGHGCHFHGMFLDDAGGLGIHIRSA